MFRYREISDDNRSILAGLPTVESKRDYLDYLREYEWTTVTAKPIEFATFRDIVANDNELRTMLEQENDPVLVAELLSRRYPGIFFSIEHVFQIYTDWKIKWTKKVAKVGGGAMNPFNIPDRLLANLADPVLEMLARRWFRKEIRYLNTNPEATIKKLHTRLAKEKNSKQRKLVRYLLDEIRTFMAMEFPEFVEELVPGKPFPSVHVRLWIQQILDKKNALIVGDVGTQKTSASVIGLEKLGCRAVIVCCRSYARQDVWASEIKRYYRQQMDPFVVNSADDIRTLERMKPEDLRRHRFIIVGYGNVQEGHADLDDENQNTYGDRLADALIRLKPDGIIIDEAHAIKGKGSRSRRVLRIAQTKTIKHRVLLTATPFENRPNEVAHLATLLAPEKYPVPEVFLASCRDNPRIFFVTMTQLMCDYFAQEDVLELPSTNVSLYHFFPTIELECPKDMERIQDAIRNDGDLEARQQVNCLTRLLSVPAALRDTYPSLRNSPCFRDALANPKIAYLKKEVAKRIKTGKVVIASGIFAAGITRELESEPDVQQIADLFEEWFPRQVLKIDGKTLQDGVNGRSDVKDRWCNDPEARILIASVQATSESLNLTLKRIPGKVEKVTMYYLSLPWKPTQYLQFNGRFRRPGSEVPIEVFALILKGTADDALVELNERKWRNFLIGVHGIPLQTEEEEALNRATFAKIITTPAQWLRDIFYSMLGRGEEKIESLLPQDYKDMPVADTMARYYLMTEEFGTSGHISRVVAPTLTAWRASGVIPSWNEVLDVGPGPLVLERRLDVAIPAIEINPMMIEIGAGQSRHGGKKAIRGRASRMPKAWTSAYSLVVASLVFDLTSRKALAGSEKNKEIERSRILREFNRVLKPGGLLWFTFQERCFDEESFDVFTDALKPFGFEVVDPWTNRIQAMDHKKHAFAFWSVLVRKTGVVIGKPDCPLFQYEQPVHGRRKVKGLKLKKELIAPVQSDPLKHEQFAICKRNGSFIPIAMAAALVTRGLDVDVLFKGFVKAFGIQESTTVGRELRKQIARLKPSSKGGLKEIWRLIREQPGVPRISWADLSKALQPYLVAS